MSAQLYTKLQIPNARYKIVMDLSCAPKFKYRPQHKIYTPMKYIMSKHTWLRTMNSYFLVFSTLSFNVNIRYMAI
jgi:hypothetical protein